MMGDAAEARFEADLAKAIALSLQTEAKDTERRRISGSAQINLPPGKSCYIEHSERTIVWGAIMCYLCGLSIVWHFICSLVS